MLTRSSVSFPYLVTTAKLAQAFPIAQIILVCLNPLV